MPSNVFGQWRAWGVDLREIYLSCNFGVVIAQDEARSAASLGSKIKGDDCEIDVAESGELLVRGSSLFIGDWHDGATRRREHEIWYRTGDFVRVDGPEIYLVARESRLVRLSGGARVNLDRVSAALKRSAFISDVLLIGEGRPALSALIVLDLESVTRWARSAGLTQTSRASLAESPDVREKIAFEIAAVAEDLAESERICGFRILSVELDPALGVITPSRIAVSSRAERLFASAIAEIYQDYVTGAVSTTHTGHAREQPSCVS
jgi:long-chain acyl-CoA synthetase